MLFFVQFPVLTLKNFQGLFLFCRGTTLSKNFLQATREAVEDLWTSTFHFARLKFSYPPDTQACRPRPVTALRSPCHSLALARPCLVLARPRPILAQSIFLQHHFGFSMSDWTEEKVTTVDRDNQTKKPSQPET